MIKPYSGSLIVKEIKKDKIAFKGWASINHQRARCNNPKHFYFKYYGAKGIKVEYSTRDFIGWFVVNYKKFKGKMPTVGRIDHSKNYSFNNIEFQTRADNSREMCLRMDRDFQKKRIKIFYLKTGKTEVANSITEAAKKSRMSVATVSRHINNRVSKKILRTGPQCGILFKEL